MSLHLVTQSSLVSRDLTDCLAVYLSNDALLLLGDAIYSLFDQNITLPTNAYVLTEEWQLRFGTQSPPVQITLIDHGQWVDLAVIHTQSVTWC